MILVYLSMSVEDTSSTLFTYTTLFRSAPLQSGIGQRIVEQHQLPQNRGVIFVQGTRYATKSGAVLRICKELGRSEEHTSELQSRGHLVCSLLLEKKNKFKNKEFI